MPRGLGGVRAGSAAPTRVRGVKSAPGFGAQGAAAPGGFSSRLTAACSVGPWGSVQIRIAWEQAAPAPRPRGRSPGLPGTNLLPPTVTRGDVFALPEDDYLDYNLTVELGTVESTEAAPTELPTSLLPAEPTLETTPGPEETLTDMPVEEVPSTTPDVFEEQEPVEEPEELCSGKPFDAFTNLKNGSIYAFRGTLGTFSGCLGHAAALSPCAGGCGPSCRSHLPSPLREVLLRAGRDKRAAWLPQAHQ